MKKFYLTLTILIISFTLRSQIKFEKGYFIDNQNKKTECLIKNLDWKNNPTNFEYRLSESEESSKKTIDEINEFGIYGESKYIRANVKADLSSTELSSLNFSKEQNFIQVDLFLKVLVEGAGSLYYYEENAVQKFFYKTSEKNNIE